MLSIETVLTGRGIDREIIQYSPIVVNSNQTFSITADSLSRTRLFCAEIAKIAVKNLAMLTICNQSYETQCILRAIDSITELFLDIPEGERLVPVPILDIGCEVGLHRGKWRHVPEYK